MSINIEKIIMEEYIKMNNKQSDYIKIDNKNVGAFVINSEIHDYVIQNIKIEDSQNAG